MNDIINTLLDGASGLVLAAETAVGKHPVGAVDIILAMIERFRRSAEGHRIEDLVEASPSLLPSLHGRAPLEVPASHKFVAWPIGNTSRLPSIEVDEETAIDIEHLAHGVYSPLRGFMTQEELESVLDHCRLPGDHIWTMPIVLQGNEQEFAAYQPGQAIRLLDARMRETMAILHLYDKYEIDWRSVAWRWFGTTDESHPGVARLVNRGLTFLGGPLEYLSPASITRSPYELTPAQTRMIFDIKGWNKVVAFHSDDLPHRGHEYVITRACERCHADGILLHPAIGPNYPTGERSPDTILGAYERLIRFGFPSALLAAFRVYSRYSGPREAAFAALCHKNFGCTHFVLGRVGSEANDRGRPYWNREFFESLGDLGITPVIFDTVYFSEAEQAAIESHQKTADLREISERQIRTFLAAGKAVPSWCMREELSQWLTDERSAATLPAIPEPNANGDLQVHPSGRVGHVPK